MKLCSFEAVALLRIGKPGVPDFEARESLPGRQRGQDDKTRTKRTEKDEPISRRKDPRQSRIVTYLSKCFGIWWL